MDDMHMMAFKILKKKDGKEREILVCLAKELLLDLSGVFSYHAWNDVFNWKLEATDKAEIFFTPYLLSTILKY